MSKQLTPDYEDLSLRTYNFTIPKTEITLTQDLAEDVQPFDEVFNTDAEQITRVMKDYMAWCLQFFEEKWEGKGRGGGLIFMRLLLEHWLCSDEVSDEDKRILLTQILYSYSEHVLEEADLALAQAIEENDGEPPENPIDSLFDFEDDDPDED